MNTTTTGPGNASSSVVPPNRYSEAELEEFRSIIESKLGEARETHAMLVASLVADADNGTDDTARSFTGLSEDGGFSQREELAELATRQEKFIEALDNALLRIRNKTYGMCRVTGQLIPKERLRLVPHATLSMQAKSL